MKATWTRLQVKPDPQHGVPCARSSHGVSLVQQGSRLIVYGGELQARTPLPREMACWAVDHLQDDNNNKATWRRLFDGDDNTRTGTCTGATFPPDRIAHAQAVHQDKYVYIFGGRAGVTMEERPMNDLWKLDCSGAPGSETWSQVICSSNEGDAPPEPRSFHRMICVNDKLYVFGGCGANGRLADLHEFCLNKKKWKTLQMSALKGRGGPNLTTFDGGAKLGVVAGFSGAETADGQFFDVSSGKWDPVLLALQKNMRPRSVCVVGSFPSLESVVIFGGEVDPSDRGHEGAGGFENDLVILDEKTGAFQEGIRAPVDTKDWPETRGWSDADVMDVGNGKGQMFIYGGLSGDDTSPRRLDDLWRLDLKK